MAPQSNECRQTSYYVLGGLLIQLYGRPLYPLIVWEKSLGLVERFDVRFSQDALATHAMPKRGGAPMTCNRARTAARRDRTERRRRVVAFCDDPRTRPPARARTPPASEQE